MQEEEDDALDLLKPNIYLSKVRRTVVSIIKIWCQEQFSAHMYFPEMIQRFIGIDFGTLIGQSSKRLKQAFVLLYDMINISS